MLTNQPVLSTIVPAGSGRAWFHSLLMRDPGRWTGRLLAWLGRLSYGRRRRLGQALAPAAAGLSGLALLALLAGPAVPPAAAASITVDGTCTLIDAIIAANTDQPQGGCAAGSGADTITLTADLTYLQAYDGAYKIATPMITSTITIVADAGTRTITLDNTAGQFRAFYVYDDGATALGDLTLTNINISGGDSGGAGGGQIVVDGGKLTISGGTFSGGSGGLGGAVFLMNDARFSIDSADFTENYASQSGGAIYVYEGAAGAINNSAIHHNSADSSGAFGTHTAQLTVTNSTINHNSADRYAGAAEIFRTSATFENVTISYNSAGTYAGGISAVGGSSNPTIVSLTHVTAISNTATGGNTGFLSSGSSSTTTINAGLISGNQASGTGDEIDQPLGTVTITNSVVGHAGVSNDQAFFGAIAFDAGTMRATSDGDQPTALADIVDTTLADNGGPTLTHALPEGSPAIDIYGDGACVPATDQRGEPRPQGEGCDAGAFELGPDSASVFISTWTAGAVDGLAYGPHDILRWDGEAWTKWFDGTAAGLEPLGKWKHNLNAIWISDTESAELIFSLTQDNRTVPGVPGIIDGMDLLRWDGDALSLWFDGQDVGLNVKTQEKIDGLHVLPAAPDWSEFSGRSCQAYLLLSTQGAGMVPKPGNIKPKNVLKFGGEDILGFCATNLGRGTAGTTTTGYWEMVLDGSADGVKKNNIDSISMNEDGSVLYLTSRKTFAVDDALGGHSEVFTFDMAAEKRIKRAEADGDFGGPLFSVYDAGMAVGTRVDALHVVGELSLP